jgi:transmembrane sensor
MQKDPRKLLEKYKAGNCADKEKAIVESWYLELQSGEAAPAHGIIKGTKEEIWDSLSANQSKSVKKHYLLRVATWAAAIIIIGSISLVYLNKTRKPQLVGRISKNNDIAPGSNKAFLTLADGRKISLTDAANGQLVKQQGLVINKTADGQLVYTVADSGNEDHEGRILFNTIETPKGGKYQINLSDGTRVWLNAASSLRYPTKFIGNTRTVELTGEGYFEVAKVVTRAAKRIPFMVKSGGQEVEVLGTHFNINSYKDEENIKTTLLEGAVRVVQQNKHEVVLKPGEQSQLNENTINVKTVDTETVMAWKEGDFVFDGDDLKSIMRKVARWYDVEVIYKGEFDNLRFGGFISRTKNISSVLGIMESTGRIHFAIEGKRVTVLHNAE